MSPSRKPPLSVARFPATPIPVSLAPANQESANCVALSLVVS